MQSERAEGIPFAQQPDFRGLLEGIREYAIFLVGTDRVIGSWNRGVEDAFGYRRSEFVGLSFRELFTPEDVEAGVPDDEISRAAADEVTSCNRWHVRKDGTRFWASGVTTALAGADGEPSGFVKVVRDRTSEKEAEELRRRSEEELMRATQDVMQDASWFSRSIVERLAQLRSGSVDPTRIAYLTRRERQVLERLARGSSNADIAEDLGIAAQTVRNYITAVYEKIGVKSRVEAVVWARERGLGL